VKEEQLNGRSFSFLKEEQSLCTIVQVYVLIHYSKSLCDFEYEYKQSLFGTVTDIQVFIFEIKVLSGLCVDNITY
jgi:hypothetical protein